METIQMVLLICAGAGMFILMGVIPLLANHYSLNGIKSKTVGDGPVSYTHLAKPAKPRRQAEESHVRSQTGQEMGQAGSV